MRGRDDKEPPCGVATVEHPAMRGGWRFESSCAHMWFVYIVRCNDGTLYTGITNNIAQRLHQHNNTLVGSRYTSSRRPVVLAYKEKVSSRGDALKREAAIKKVYPQRKGAPCGYSEADSI